MSVTSLPGDPVALAAYGNKLAVVWHAGWPTVDGSQTLHYAVFELALLTQASAGHLPLSAGATLAWLGFGEAGQLAAYDTAVRTRAPWSMHVTVQCSATPPESGLLALEQAFSDKVPRCAGSDADAQRRPGQPVGAGV